MLPPRPPITWAEVSGSLGDLGTFLPLLVGMVQKVQLDLGTSLIFTGLYNIASGALFGIPMAVQPMKTVAALAIAGSIDLPEALVAGIFVSATVLLLGVTRLIDSFNALIPHGVVRGVQLAVGVKLAIKGAQLALLLPGKSGLAGLRQAWGVDGWVLAVATLLYILLAGRPDVLAAATDSSSPAQLGTTTTVRQAFAPLAARVHALWRQASWAHSNESSSTAVPGAASRVEPGVAPGQPTDSEPLLAAQGGGDGGWGGSELSGTRDRRETGIQTQGGGGADPDGDTAADAHAVAVLSSSLKSRRGEGASPGPADRAPVAAAPPPAPTALLVVAAGLLIAIATHPEALSELRLGPSVPRLLKPTWQQVREGILTAGLAQLPLTTLNSVVAVTQLACQLFPDQDASRWRPSRVATSVGLMNLAGAWLGALPVCHGCGGLMAQTRFGARTGAAPMLLGGLKLMLGLLLGSSLLVLLALLPSTLLGPMLLVSGMELACVCLQESHPRGKVYLMLTAVVSLAVDHVGVGFLAGVGAAAATAGWELVVCPAAGLLGVHARRVWPRRRQSVLEV